ncbi:hypothetical protein Hanom_Chr15g01401261 [Helianthus anomalus]
MAGGYPFPVKPQGPSNHERSSRHHLNIRVSNPLTSNPEGANPFRSVVYRLPTSNHPLLTNPPSVTNSQDDDLFL